MIGLSSFGVAAGRFQRFNSWDLFSKPHVLLPDVLGRLLDPIANARTTVATIVLALFLLTGYLTLAVLTRIERREGQLPLRA